MKTVNYRVLTKDIIFGKYEVIPSILEQYFRGKATLYHLQVYFQIMHWREARNRLNIKDYNRSRLIKDVISKK